MRIFFYLLLLLDCSYALSQDTLQQVVPSRRNSPAQQKKPYVILISVDGLGAGMLEKYKATNITGFAKKGVTAAYMLPSFPSLTFPNHYTIVTGLYPAHHGLVNNTFYDAARDSWYSMGNKDKVRDGSWYGGTPLWSLAEQQQMLTASYYWVASESSINGTRPTYYFNYNEKTTIDDRIQTVKEWLQLPEAERPHFITFYFPQVDHEAHEFGPDSKETGEAVSLVDRGVGKLVKTIDSLHLPVNYILLSDHGLAAVDRTKAITALPGVDTTQFAISLAAAVVQLYVKKKENIKTIYTGLKKNALNYKVYLTADTPKQWHFGKTDDRYNRIGDIVAVAVAPAYFDIGRRRNTNLGVHGFDPASRAMHASFYAWGPAFRQVQIGRFENIHVFPLITSILGLPYNFPIDGKRQTLAGILRK